MNVARLSRVFRHRDTVFPDGGAFSQRWNDCIFAPTYGNRIV